MGKIAQTHRHVLDLLIPPMPVEETDERLRSRILVGVIVYVLLAVVLMLLVRIITEGVDDTVMYTLGFIPVLFSLLLVFWLTRSRRLTGDIMIILILALLLLVAWRDGGLYARTIFWYPAIPLLANFLGGRIRSLASTVLTSLLLIGMYIAHSQNVLPQYAEIDLLEGRLAAALASVIFVALISYWYEDSHERAKQEREALKSSKSNWVSMVSHELRTPLTAIQGSLSLALHQYQGQLQDEVSQMLNIAHSNCQRLVRLVNDVLDIEKIESGQLTLKRQPVNLQELITETVASQRDMASASRISVETVMPEGPVVIDIDADRIIQVLQNLMGNAIKFSPPDSAVIITMQRMSDELEVSVKDFGTGVPPEFVDQLFMRFAQAEHTQTRQFSGSGLGLNISRSIIEQHGGEIGYRPNTNKGSVFYFRLPLPD